MKSEHQKVIWNEKTHERYREREKKKKHDQKGIGQPLAGIQENFDIFVMETQASKFDSNRNIF